MGCNSSSSRATVRAIILAIFLQFVFVSLSFAQEDQPVTGPEQQPFIVTQDAEQVYDLSVDPSMDIQAVGDSRIFGTSSPFNTLIPSNAIYTRENRIGVFRNAQETWSFKVYRVARGSNHPNVSIINAFDRTASWPIPTYAVPGLSSNGHMSVIDPDDNMVYEFIGMKWDGNTIRPHSMVAYPLSGSGVVTIAPPITTASGFSVLSGSIMREDFLDPATGRLSTTPRIDHALAMTMTTTIVQRDAFVSPAMMGEPQGTAGPSGIPLGARFALPRNLNVDTLNVHPLTREMLRAARDYGIYISDVNTATPVSSGKYLGTVRFEEGILQEVYGKSNDAFISQLQNEISSVISQYGIYRVTTGCGSLIQEAEKGILAGKFKAAYDTNASGAYYIHVPSGNGDIWTTTSNTSTATYCFTVPTDGVYKIKAWVHGTAGNDSFFVKFNNTTSAWDTLNNTTYLPDYVNNRGVADPMQYALTAGNYEMVVYWREDAARLDKLELERVGTATQLPTCGGLLQQAEAGVLSGSFVVGSDSAASGGKYVHTPNGSGAYWSPTSNSIASYCFNVTTAGTYRVKAWVHGRADDDSFYVHLNGNTSVWDMKVNTSYASDYVSHRGGSDPVSYNLGTGSYLVEFRLREDGARIDRVELVRVSTSGRPISSNEGPAETGVNAWSDSDTYAPHLVWHRHQNEDGSFLSAPWYNVVLVDANDNYLLDQWYEGSSVCAEFDCILTSAQASVLDGLTNGTYRWWVRSYNDGVYSNWGEESRWTLEMPVPAQPAIIEVDMQTGSPVVVFGNDVAAAWYQVRVTDAQSQQVYSQWFSKAQASCVEEGNCTLPLSVTDLNGEYNLSIQSWGPGGFNGSSADVWSAPVAFQIGTVEPVTPAPALLTNAVGTITEGAVSLSWTHDANAQWYQVWVGTPDYQTVLDQWYSAEEAGCTSGTCTVTPALSLTAGTAYDWYVRAWGPGGFSAGGEFDGWTQGSSLMP